jgi:hypothetical protein
MQTRYNKTQLSPGVMQSGYEGSNNASNFVLPSCGIEDVDRAFFELFDKVLPFSYKSKKDSEVRKVPVVFASGERFALAAKKSPIRDNQGALILPLISISRSGIEQTASKGFGVSEHFNEMVVKKRVSSEDPLFQALQNSNGFLNTGRQQSASSSETDFYKETGRLLQPKMGTSIYEVLVIPMPKYFTVKYEITLWAQYVGQLNTMITTLLGSYINGHRSVKITTSKGYWFVAYFESSINNSGNLDSFSDEERLVKATVSAEVPGYLILPEIDGIPSGIKSYLSAPTVSFGSLSEDSSLTQVTPIVSGKVESFTLSDVSTDDNERPSGAVGENSNAQSERFAGAEPDGTSVVLSDVKPTTSPVGGTGKLSSRKTRIVYDADPITGKKGKVVAYVTKESSSRGEQTILLDEFIKL